VHLYYSLFIQIITARLVAYLNVNNPLILDFLTLALICLILVVVVVGLVVFLVRRKRMKKN